MGHMSPLQMQVSVRNILSCSYVTFLGAVCAIPASISPKTISNVSLIGALGSVFAVEVAVEESKTAFRKCGTSAMTNAALGVASSNLKYSQKRRSQEQRGLL